MPASWPTSDQLRQGVIPRDCNGDGERSIQHAFHICLLCHLVDDTQAKSSSTVLSGNPFTCS